MRAISFVRKFPKDNGYARPVEGVMAYVNLENECMIRVDDHGVVPMPPEHGNYDAASVGEMRSDLKPIEITQPEGPSFSVDGAPPVRAEQVAARIVLGDAARVRLRAEVGVRWRHVLPLFEQAQRVQAGCFIQLQPSLVQ